ncbi:MAG: hypothetical protein HFJ17_05480 [Clostridia bacterium]|nr:hypothetical protein [Clostridia bacterium]
MKDIIFPDYKNSILNIVNSILKNYNVKTKYNGQKELDIYLKEKYDNIVLIILDGMGEHILNNISPKGFLKANQKAKITSVYPSTTTAAITTYYSGKPPIETGWIAMSQYFKEYGRSIEMLKEKDSYTGKAIDDARIDVYDLVKYDTIYEQIEKSSPEVNAYEINPTYCKARSKRNINADNIDILCDSIDCICKNNEKNFVLAYSDNPDGLLHKYGCKSKEVEEYILNAQEKIKKLCENIKDTNTLLIVSADHGHKDIEKTYNNLELKDIQECLIMPPSLESRVVTFWVKENKKDKFEKIFKNKFSGEFLLYTKEEFLEKKLLGDGEKHPKIDDFIGNYIALSIGSSIIKLGTNVGKEKSDKKSTHCGLTPDEMEVPLIIIK